MKRVLCISPHFPPVNAPDMQRLRQSLPYFKEFGWEPVVFAVKPDLVEGAKDPLLLETLPAEIAIHHTGALPASLTRRLGLGNLGIRSWLSMRDAVDRYLAANHVDLIYFSTTVFTTMSLGPRWRKQFGVPFVIDLQDPWRNDYYLALPPKERPRKFWFDYLQKKYLEAYTMPQASGVTAVSQSYIDEVRVRYPVLQKRPSRELVFGFDERDYEAADRLGVTNSVFEKSPDEIALVFAGVTPKSMEKSIRLFMAALQRMISGAGSRPVKAYFVGTHYSVNADDDPDDTLVMRAAKDHGVAEHVIEVRERKSYFEALKIMRDADILLILGVETGSYSPSKLASTLFARKPLLAIVHEESNVAGLLNENVFGSIIGFGASKNDEAAIDAASRRLLAIVEGGLKAPTVPSGWLDMFSARSKCRELCELLDLAVLT